jgi:hypothetical protein
MSNPARPILRVLLLAALLAAAVAAPRAQDAGFVAGVDDLPLMPGLSGIADSGLVFDTPSGRIVEAYAQGGVARAAVLAFYRKTLPQLGWAPAGKTAFRREGESLKLDFLDGGGALIVRYTLTPD